MKAVKENKVYTIDESQRKTYAALGFDITDDSGRILEYAAGKTVPYAKYAALLDENRRLKAEIKSREGHTAVQNPKRKK